MFNSVYKNKRVLVTGHTGFKGSWMSIWLNSLGAKVYGLSLDPNCSPSNYDQCDLRSQLAGDFRADVTCKQDVQKIINDVQPEFIFHLAAQALVKDSYKDPVRTMAVNAIGTANVLDAVRSIKSKVTVILITSDKCYDNVEFLWGYKETDRLGGKDPYSASKAMAEIAINSFVNSYFTESANVNLGVGRAGNVIGGGDWSANRIIPDCVQAWSRGETVDIRSPKATRPWQHVLEPLSGYLHLGSVLYNSKSVNGEAFNFGPPSNSNFSVEQLIEKMSSYWDQVSWKDTSADSDHVHEAGLLRLNCEKAQTLLDWESVMNFDETVQLTSAWYQGFYSSTSPQMLEITIEQIQHYVELAVIRGRKWVK